MTTANSISFYDVLAAFPLRDGGVAVADRRSRRVALFDSMGTPRLTLRLSPHTGRPIGVLGWMGVLGRDTLLVFDGQDRSVTAISTTGAELWYTTLPNLLPSGRRLRRVVGALGRTSLVLEYFDTFPAQEGLIRPQVALVSFDIVTHAAHELIAVPGDEVLLTNLGDSSLAMLQPLFARRSLVAVFSNDVIVADSERCELRILAPDGSTTGVIQCPLGPFSVEPDDVHAAISAMRRDMPYVSPLIINALTQNAPATLPALGDLLPAPDGQIWLRPFASPSAKEDIWWILDKSGAILATLRTKAGLRILSVSHGLAVISFAANREEIVEVRRIVRESAVPSF